MLVGVASGDYISAEQSSDGKVHWGGAGWARLGQYLPLLEHEVIIGTLVWHYNCFKIMTPDKVMHDIHVVILQRIMNEGLDRHIKLARKIGQVVINDVDDWYWGLDPNNQAWHASHPRANPVEHIYHYKSVVMASSLITVSTPYLQERISRWNPKCEVLLVPNTVDIARFKKHDHTKRVPVVGWAGSTDHRSGDLEVLRGILTTTHKTTTHKYTLLHSGARIGSRTFAEAVGVPLSAVKTKPATDAEDYPSLLTMDIGLAPLRNCAFNHAKSEIKLLEYSASGIPWIASKTPAYVALHNTIKAGRIAKKPVDWSRHLKQLCGSAQLRSDEGNELFELVKRYDIRHGVDKWHEVIGNTKA